MLQSFVNIHIIVKKKFSEESYFGVSYIDDAQENYPLSDFESPNPFKYQIYK